MEVQKLTRRRLSNILSALPEGTYIIVQDKHIYDKNAPIRTIRGIIRANHGEYLGQTYVEDLDVFVREPDGTRQTQRIVDHRGLMGFVVHASFALKED